MEDEERKCTECGGPVAYGSRHHHCGTVAMKYKGEQRVLAELLRDATAVLRTIDPEDATEGEQLEALIDRAEKAYGAILETPNNQIEGRERP